MKILIVKWFWICLLAVLVMASTGCSAVDPDSKRSGSIPVTGSGKNDARRSGEIPVSGAALTYRDEITGRPLPLENAPAQSATPVPEPTAAPPIMQPAPSWQLDTESPTAPDASIPSAPGKHILVDLSEQRVYAYENGALVYEFPVSTGRNDNTAVGVFKILDKKPYPYSEPWGFWMPHWMGIYWVAGMENGFHALPVLENGKELWGDQIGAPASNGCVVLLPEDMAALYEWSEVGMPVEIVE